MCVYPWRGGLMIIDMGGLTWGNRQFGGNNTMFGRLNMQQFLELKAHRPVSNSRTQFSRTSPQHNRNNVPQAAMNIELWTYGILWLCRRTISATEWQRTQRTAWMRALRPLSLPPPAHRLDTTPRSGPSFQRTRDYFVLGMARTIRLMPPVGSMHT